jgi:hypothetical protein
MSPKNEVAELRREIRGMRLLLLVSLSVAGIMGFAKDGKSPDKLVVSSVDGEMEAVLTPAGLDFYTKNAEAGGARVLSMRIAPHQITLISKDGNSHAIINPNQLGLEWKGVPRAVLEGDGTKYRLAFSGADKSIQTAIGIEGDKAVARIPAMATPGQSGH